MEISSTERNGPRPRRNVQLEVTSGLIDFYAIVCACLIFSRRIDRAQPRREKSLPWCKAHSLPSSSTARD